MTKIRLRANSATSATSLSRTDSDSALVSVETAPTSFAYECDAGVTLLSARTLRVGVVSFVIGSGKDCDPAP